MGSIPAGGLYKFYLMKKVFKTYRYILLVFGEILQKLKNCHDYNVLLSTLIPTGVPDNLTYVSAGGY